MFIWLPAYVNVTKMIPADIEVVVNSIVQTMQAGSSQVIGRLLTVGISEAFLASFKGLTDIQAISITLAIACCTTIG